MDWFSNFWDTLGTGGHVAIYAGLMSILAVVFEAMSKLGGVAGKVGLFLKKIVDFFSANIAHKTETPK